MNQTIFVPLTSEKGCYNILPGVFQDVSLMIQIKMQEHILLAVWASRCGFRFGVLPLFLSFFFLYKKKKKYFLIFFKHFFFLKKFFKYPPPLFISHNLN